MYDLTVYTYGTAEFTSQIFNAVAAAVGSKSFNTVMLGAFTIAGFVAVIEYSMKRNVSVLAITMMQYIFITSILVYPKTNVTIHDDIVNNNYGVANVPAGLAVPAHFVTSLFHGLTTLIEQVLHHPNDPTYSKKGFLFASHLVRNTAQMQITDPDFKKALNSFIEQCIFYDVYLGVYTTKDLLTSNDIWSLVTTNASPSRSFLLDNKATTCKTGIEVLGKRWKDMESSTIKKYAKMLMPGVGKYHSDNNVPISKYIINNIDQSYGYLTGVSKNSSDLLRQVLLVNAIESSAINNPELGMQSYAVTKANAQKSVANFAMSIMSARWLPAMYGAIENMIYALFMVVIPICLFSGGLRAFGNYVMSMVWVGSWPIVYAILHFGCMWIIRNKSNGVGVSFYDLNNLTQIQYDMASLFGYFTILVPFISGGVIMLSKRGLASTFTSMSQLVGGSTQSLAFAASGEAVSGNLSMGNTNFDNSSMYNMSGYKQDMNASYASGAHTVQQTDGSFIKSFANGQYAVDMQNATSNTLLSANYAERKSTAFSENADYALSESATDQKNISSNLSSVSSSLYAVGHNLNTGINSGSSFSESKSAGYAKSAAEFASSAEKFAQDRGISTQEASKLLFGAYGNLSGNISWDSKQSALGSVVNKVTGGSAGASLTAGVKAEGDVSSTSQSSENYSAAVDFIKNNNLSNTIEHAVRGIEENSYRTDTRDGYDLSERLHTSYDQLKQASTSYNAHISEASSYRKAASETMENSANLNYNANQQLFEYIANQPMTSGQGPMGAHQAEALIRNHPELAKSYAEQFVNNKVQSEMQSFKQQNISKSSVIDNSNKHLSKLSNSSIDIQNSHDSARNEVAQSRFGRNIAKANVDNSVKTITGNILSKSGKDIGNKETSMESIINNNKDQIMEKVNKDEK